MAALRAAAEAKLKASSRRGFGKEPRFTVKQSASSLTMLLHVAGGKECEAVSMPISSKSHL